MPNINIYVESAESGEEGLVRLHVGLLESNVLKITFIEISINTFTLPPLTIERTGLHYISVVLPRTQLLLSPVRQPIATVTMHFKQYLIAITMASASISSALPYPDVVDLSVCARNEYCVTRALWAVSSY